MRKETKMNNEHCDECGDEMGYSFIDKEVGDICLDCFNSKGGVECSQCGLYPGKQRIGKDLAVDVQHAVLCKWCAHPEYCCVWNGCPIEEFVDTIGPRNPDGDICSDCVGYAISFMEDWDSDDPRYIELAKKVANCQIPSPNIKSATIRK